MTRQETKLTMPSDTEMVVTRIFDAPPALVWKAWTDPDHLPRWWGPRGFSTSTRRLEIKPGGEWRFVMHGPDGRDYQNLVTFTEVVDRQRLVYRHGGGEADLEPVNFSVIVTFAPEGPSGERTLLTMTSTFPSKSVRDHVIRQYGADEGARQHLTRLAEYLPTMNAGATGKTFVTSRVFAAPRDLVWKAWTTGEHLPKWFGPKGMTMPTSTLDLRPGGVFHYLLRAPNGGEIWAKWVFREVSPPDRLVFVSSFADAKGATARAPFADDWPMETLSTVTFAPHAGLGGGTVVTVSAQPIDATPAERRRFEEGFESMIGGWGGTFDRLESHLRGA
jgi:uncharacterized protein YndB with AHSA1/START domain